MEREIIQEKANMMPMAIMWDQSQPRSLWMLRKTNLMALPQMRKVQGKKARVKMKVIITGMTAEITMKIMKITAAIMTVGTMTAMTVSIESLL